MPRNFFITGLPKSGKTTVLRKLIEELKKKGLRVGGFISPEEKEHGTREGFYAQDVETGKIAELASVKGDGPKVSKYYVNVKAFESIAVPAMEKVDDYDVLVLDEIGRMEMKSMKFVELLDKVFESPTPVVASIHEDYLATYGINGETFLVTQTNREAVFMELFREATQEYTKKPVKKEKAKPARREKKAKAVKKEKKKAGKKPEKRKAEEKKPEKAKKEAVPKEEKKEERKEERAEEKPARKGMIGKVRDLLGF